nr:uncharacterized protein LOC127298808 isoform X2 [Lolium perenne]
MRPAGAAAGVCVCDGWGNWVYGVPWIHLIQKAGSILLNANPLFQAILICRVHNRVKPVSMGIPVDKRLRILERYYVEYTSMTAKDHF